MPVDSIGQPEVLMCLSPIWTEKHETARRLAQRIKIVLDVAKSKGFRSGENPVSAIRDAQVLRKVKAKPKHHVAMKWQDVSVFFAELATKKAMSAKALMMTCLSGSRTGEVLGLRWTELHFDDRIWISAACFACACRAMDGRRPCRCPPTPPSASRSAACLLGLACSAVPSARHRTRSAVCAGNGTWP
jgi:hypothetical protein